MTNAKSRLVRIIALALVVLMIVPAALVGCGKPADDANNAAIEEALAAAQAAKDAADKAAADAQAAIDAANKQIEEAKKQAADAQAKAEELDKTLESMKNTTTTAAPATTTAAPAPEVDKVVLDAHIADILQNGESEYNKLYAKYNYVSAAYAADQQAVIAKLFADAYIAILRADTVDYANALVANLAAAFDAVPTYSEVVKAAYDAIDFASDKDVIDVVKAQKLVEAAKADLVYTFGAAQETKDAVNAEIKALSAFGEAELDLVALIATEYYRYTGVELVDADKDAVEEVLYKDIYDEAQATELDIAAKVIALYVALTAEGELDVKNVVYSEGLEGKVEDAVEAYADYKIFVEDEGAGDLYADFCIAFVGAQFILEQDGDYLSAKLAEAEARAKELLVAYEELDEFYVDLKEIVDNYYNDGVTPSGATEAYYFTYLDQYEDVADVAAQLEAWVNKYGFEYDDANFEAMMGTKVTDVTYYQGFLAAKAYTDALGVWFAALDAIDDNSLEDALEDYNKLDAQNNPINIFDYEDDGAAVKALIAWYYTVTKDGKVVNQGIEDAVVKFDGIKAIKDFAAKDITDAAIAELLDEVDLTVANVATLKTALAAFEDDNGYLDKIADINKAIKELDLAKLTVEDLGDITIATDIDTLARTMKMIEDEDAKYGWSTKSLNYKLLPFEAIDEIAAAKDALVGALLDKAAVIVETYIGWAGAVDSKGYVVYPAGSPDKAHVYKVNPVEITIYSYDLIKSLKDVYDEVNIYELFSILGANEGVEVVNKQGKAMVYNAKTVVSMYRQLSDTYYYVAIANLNSATNAIRNSTVVGTYVDAANEWMHKFSAAPKFDDTDDSISKKLYAYSELYGAYGLEYVFVTGDAGKDNKINVYDTTASAGNDEKTYLKAVEAVNADKYAVYEGSGSSKTLVDFNEAEYKKAVDAKVAEYRTSWYSDASKGYITKAATAAKLDAYKEAIYKAALAYGLYEIEAEFTMAKEDYKVVVATSNSVFQDKNVGTTPVAEVTVYDDKNKVTTLAEAITVKYENGDAVLYYGAAKLADKDDDTSKNAPKFVYTFADAASTIVANCAKLNGIVMNGGTKNTFVKYEQAWFDAILDAEIKNDFYNGRAAVLAEAEAAVTAQKTIADEIGDALIDKLHTEYKNVWNDKLAYSATALDELKGATAAFIDQLENIAAEHPATANPIAE